MVRGRTLPARGVLMSEAGTFHFPRAKPLAKKERPC